ncbi:MAG: hypothetical protein MJ211_13705 [Bacteroidales bacterium]|nr:hypothetical protein [Bacteroidales bacterium]
MKTKLFFVVLIFTIFSLSCETEENPVPDVRVDFEFSLNNAQYSNLQNPGGWVYLTGGYNGIFVYNVDCDTYYAYDRSCTANNKHTCLVYDEKEHCLLHTDTCENCSSKFSVPLKGAVIQGPAKFPLRQYEVYKTQNGRLRITNNYFGY